MSACETCWGDAYARARMLGGTQVEHYRALLTERADDHAKTETEENATRAPEPLVERLAEALPDDLQPVGAGLRYIWGEDKGHLTGYGRQIIDALLPVVEQEIAAAREEALREAAKEAEERGDIGKDGGCEAWTWLRIRADRIAETP